MRFIVRAQPMNDDIGLNFCLVELTYSMVQELFERNKAMKKMKKLIPDLTETVFMNHHAKWFKAEVLEKWPELWEDLFENHIVWTNIEWPHEDFLPLGESFYCYLHLTHHEEIYWTLEYTVDPWVQETTRVPNTKLEPYLKEKSNV